MSVRRARGRLEDLVRVICDQVSMGTLKLAEGEYLTPHRLAVEIAARYPGSGSRPSTGGLADTLKRWRDVGFAEVRDNPLAFVDFTPEAFTKGLAQLKAEHKERLEDEAAMRRQARMNATAA